MIFGLTKRSSSPTFATSDPSKKRKSTSTAQPSTIPLSEEESSCRLLASRLRHLRDSNSNEAFYSLGLSTFVYGSMFIHLDVDRKRRALVISTTFFAGGIRMNKTERHSRIEIFNKQRSMNRGSVLQKQDNGLRLTRSVPLSCLNSNLDFEATFTQFLWAAKVAKQIAR